MDATNKTSKKLIRFLGDNAITLCLVVLVVVIICINPKFFSFNVLRDVLLQNATKLIMACGMMFVLISGGVDLSAGRILGLAAVLTASLGQTIDYSRRFYPNMPDIPIIVPFLVALAVCMLLGLFNGTVIAKFAIPPFIVTLGTQVIAWGVNLLYFDLPPNSSQPIGGVKKSITYMGSGLLGGKVPVIILIALAVTLAVWFILKKLRFGRNVYAVGGNAEAANVSGIKVTATLIGVYGIAGLLYGLAGFLDCLLRRGRRLQHRRHRHRAGHGRRRADLRHHQLRTHLHRRQPVLAADYQGHHHYRGGRL